MANRPRKSAAQKRLEIDQAPAATEIDELVAAALPHAAAAIETLGQAAADGDVQAAKALLDFLKSSTKDDGDSKGKDILSEIARIRERERRAADS